MTKQDIYEEVKRLEPVCLDVSRRVWADPETGGQEQAASGLLREILEKEGFQIINEKQLPYAFCAEYGKGKPVIAILGEYDALPGLSQQVCAVKKPVQDGAPGHGCGHNLLGAASVAGAIAVKRFLEKEGIEGTIRFYGCPEEELLCGKVKMAYYGMFDGCDLAVSWHPMSVNIVYDSGFLASASARYYFKGTTSHAAFAPERGRSALDAVELMSVGTNYLREHVLDKARIHYTTNSGGFSPNIVPDHADAWYYARAPHMSDVKDILRRLEKIARGAALMTETEVSVKVEYGCCEMHPGHKYADLTYENMMEAGEISYTEEELAFAKKIQDTLDPVQLAKEKQVYRASDAPMYTGMAARECWEKAPMTSSSDTGDVSQMMPMNLFSVACWPMGTAPHTWQACAAGGCSLGEKGAMHAAKIMAGIAYDLFTMPKLREEIIREFKETHTEAYQPMYQPDEPEK